MVVVEVVVVVVVVVAVVVAAVVVVVVVVALVAVDSVSFPPVQIHLAVSREIVSENPKTV